MRRTMLLCALIAASCASPAAPGEPQQIAVRVDASTSRFHASLLAYFPSRVQVRPGDTVVFEPTWTGEPHTVTLGSLVTAALAGDAAADAKLPRAAIAAGANLPPAATQPCYLESGEPPLAGAPCPGDGEQPAFDGTSPYYGSGFLAKGERFTVELSDGIPPGTYRYFCSFHGPAMSGQLDVVPPGTTVASPGDVRANGDAELDDLIDEVRPAFESVQQRFRRARVGEFPFPAAAGLRSADGRALVREFVPFTLKARAGERVSWTVSGAHVIAFRPSSNAGPPAVEQLENGSVVLNPETFRSSRSPEPPAPGEAPVAVAGEPHGRDDRHSSGLLDARGGGDVVYTLTFTDPGSHEYRCLIHPQMTGLVTISL